MSVEGIKEKLESEEEQSLDKNLKRSKTGLDSKEMEAAKKFVTKEREERNRQTAVAEELKGRIFVGHGGTNKERQIHQRLMASMPKIEEALRSRVGDEFIAVSVFGSHYKGSAREDSDADIGIFVKHIASIDKESLQKLVKDILADVTPEGKVHVGYYGGLDRAKGHIGFVNKGSDGSIKQVTTITDEGKYCYDILETAADDVLFFFDGRFFGNGIEQARKEIITELAKKPSGEGKLIWEKARELLGEHEAAWKYGAMISTDELNEIIEVKKREFPSFEEIKKRYGVA